VLVLVVVLVLEAHLRPEPARAQPAAEKRADRREAFEDEADDEDDPDHERRQWLYTTPASG